MGDYGSGEKTTCSLSNHRRTLCIVTRERNLGLLVRRCKGTHTKYGLSRFIQYGSMINGRVLCQNQLTLNVKP